MRGRRRDCWRPRTRRRTVSAGGSTNPAESRAARNVVTHDADPIRQHQRLGLIMSDVDERGAERSLQLFQLDLHVLTEFEVERSQRFVEQQQGGLQHQAACDGHSLPLTARQLVDAFAGGAVQPHALEHGVAATQALVARDSTPSQPERDVLTHRHHGKQGELLEYHVDGAAIRRDVAHARAADDDVAGIGRDEARDHAKQRGLTASRRTQYGEEAAALHRE